MGKVERSTTSLRFFTIWNLVNDAMLSAPELRELELEDFETDRVVTHYTKAILEVADE